MTNAVTSSKTKYKQLTTEQWTSFVASLKLRWTAVEPTPVGHLYVSVPVEFFNEFIVQNDLSTVDYLGNKHRSLVVPLSNELIDAIAQRGIYGVGTGAVEARTLSNFYFAKLFITPYGVRLLIAYQQLIGSWSVYSLTPEEVQLFKDKYRDLMLNS